MLVCVLLRLIVSHCILLTISATSACFTSQMRGILVLLNCFDSVFYMFPYVPLEFFIQRLRFKFIYWDDSIKTFWAWHSAENIGQSAVECSLLAWSSHRRLLGVRFPPCCAPCTTAGGCQKPVHWFIVSNSKLNRFKREEDTQTRPILEVNHVRHIFMLP